MSPIHKRGFYFGHMIACETGRSMFDFTDYGCFCGYGGEGNPVDALDTYVHRSFTISIVILVSLPPPGGYISIHVFMSFCQHVILYIKISYKFEKQ
jgi:hypothetical protein